jgi:hypothetical protein
LRTDRLSREAAGRLLEGGGPEPLRHLLTVAGGPGQWDELRGEYAARLAFVASADAATAPVTGGHRGRDTARTLSRIMAAKAIAVVALTVGAGSAAVAATGNSFGPGPFGAPTGGQSVPAATGAPGTLVANQLSDRAAEPSPPTVDLPQPAAIEAPPGPCDGGADNGCGAPTTADPSSPANRRSASPPEARPDIPSTTNRSSARRPASAFPAPAKDKNERAADGSTTKRPAEEAGIRPHREEDRPDGEGSDADQG